MSRKALQGIYFLCGGPIDVREARPTSLRDAIYRSLASDRAIEERIRLAEHYKDWSADGVYADLIEFERHLAELSSVIVLVLESPGAIAELGLFASSQQFSEKLLLFVASSHYGDTSFIRLGPVKYLEEVYKNPAHYDAWLKDAGAGRLVFDAEFADTLADDFRNAVSSRLNKPSHEHAFDRGNWLHRSLLTCELVNLMSALTVGEIRGFLKDFGIELSQAALRQKLFLLVKIGLLKIEPSGDQRFYVSNDAREFVSVPTDERVFDKDRFRTDVISYYTAHDKKRFRALQRARGSAE